MEHYSVIKKNEALLHAAVWMNLENMLNENGHVAGRRIPSRARNWALV